ncbi:claudin-11-like [Arapaima gigas]
MAAGLASSSPRPRTTGCSLLSTTCICEGRWTSWALRANCVISTALYHCLALNQLLTLPAHLQTSRVLMILASILGLPAVALVLTAVPCVSLGVEYEGAKSRRGCVEVYSSSSLCGWLLPSASWAVPWSLVVTGALQGNLNSTSSTPNQRPSQSPHLQPTMPRVHTFE